jgi:hypothetical protein
VKRDNFYQFALAILLLTGGCTNFAFVSIDGELKQWHRVRFTFAGPEASETDSMNPFLDYRLNVLLSQGDRSYLVPGFFAADGNAAESGAEAGNRWRVYFCPDDTGTWTYQVSFRQGPDVAVSDDPKAGVPVSCDGFSGTFKIKPTDKSGNDLRAKGRLMVIGGHYLRFAQSRQYFLKGGADSPENFLAYDGFDGTYCGGDTASRPGEANTGNKLHSYLPHAGDWQQGDPVWQGGKGKNIIGALNYLASEGMNSVYMLTMNVGGDGKDVWPWTGYDERYRFDCSKLDQWEIVFCRMDQLGIMQHFVTQETENETLLDEGNTGVQRKLYYRELVARFAHHPAVTWNLGEENGPAAFSPKGQTDRQRKDMAAYLKKINPYNSFVVIHTHSSDPARNNIIAPLLGNPDIDGLSVQVGDPYTTHRETKKWLDLSEQAGKSWVVCLDETGPSTIGVRPDSADPGHDLMRKYVLWANLMAGGGGVEWYFGYNYPDNDLTCEDWRSREKMWEQTRLALDFFHYYLPLNEVRSADDYTTSEEDYCLVIEDDMYVVYLPEGGTTLLDLTRATGEFVVNWYDPRHGGTSQIGTVLFVAAGDWVDIGMPPSEADKDWVAVIVKNI